MPMLKQPLTRASKKLPATLDAGNADLGKAPPPVYPTDMKSLGYTVEVFQSAADFLASPRLGETACLIADVHMALWDQLRLDDFWAERLPPSRQGTRWLNVLKTLVAYRLIDPGSEWRLHRQWYAQSAMGDLLGEEFGLVQDDKLYRCLDKLLEHKEDLFVFLQKRWRDLFQADFEVLLYDLTSTSSANRRKKGSASSAIAGISVRTASKWS